MVDPQDVRHPGTAGGFSVVETLLAAALLLFIALGLIPLFTQAIRDNSAGGDFTQGSNHGRTRLEEVLQLPFHNQDLNVPGAATELVTLSSWTQGRPDQAADPDERWWDGRPADRGLRLWSRTTRVRQYHVRDLENARLEEPLPGNTQPIFVHLKEVEVVLESEKHDGAPWEGPATSRRIVFRTLRPF